MAEIQVEIPEASDGESSVGAQSEAEGAARDDTEAEEEDNAPSTGQSTRHRYVRASPVQAQ